MVGSHVATSGVGRGDVGPAADISSDARASKCGSGHSVPGQHAVAHGALCEGEQPHQKVAGSPTGGVHSNHECTSPFIYHPGLPSPTNLSAEELATRLIEHLRDTVDDGDTLGLDLAESLERSITKEKKLARAVYTRSVYDATATHSRGGSTSSCSDKNEAELLATLDAGRQLHVWDRRRPVTHQEWEMFCNQLSDDTP